MQFLDPPSKEKIILRARPRGYFGAPLGAPRGLVWWALLLIVIRWTRMCRKKCCICLIPELASAEYSQSAFFTIFASKSARMKYFIVFCLKKVFFTIVDLGKSKHSESFGPPFQKQNFFPRKASRVLWGPPGGPKGIGLISTPSYCHQMN